MSKHTPVTLATSTAEIIENLKARLRNLKENADDPALDVESSIRTLNSELTLIIIGREVAGAIHRAADAVERIADGHDELRSMLERSASNDDSPVA